MNPIEQRLSGGHHNSLGNTEAVVEDVLASKEELETLYQCYFSEDELVRLRVSSAIKRICKAKPRWIIPYIDKLLTEVAPIDQASTQWTLATLFLWLEKDMSKLQKTAAAEHLKNNLAHHNDWIVLNTTMETLMAWSKKNQTLSNWLVPHLKRLKNDSRKSVAKRATKYLNEMNAR